MTTDKGKKFEEWARDRWCDVTDDFQRALIRMSAREVWDAHAERVANDTALGLTPRTRARRLWTRIVASPLLLERGANEDADVKIIAAIEGEIIAHAERVKDELSRQSDHYASCMAPLIEAVDAILGAFQEGKSVNTLIPKLGMARDGLSTDREGEKK